MEFYNVLTDIPWVEVSPNHDSSSDFNFNGNLNSYSKCYGSMSNGSGGNLIREEYSLKNKSNGFMELEENNLILNENGIHYKDDSFDGHHGVVLPSCVEGSAVWPDNDYFFIPDSVLTFLEDRREPRLSDNAARENITNGCSDNGRDLHGDSSIISDQMMDVMIEYAILPEMTQINNNCNKDEIMQSKQKIFKCATKRKQGGKIIRWLYDELCDGNEFLQWIDRPSLTFKIKKETKIQLANSWFMRNKKKTNENNRNVSRDYEDFA